MREAKTSGKAKNPGQVTRGYRFSSLLPSSRSTKSVTLSLVRAGLPALGSSSGRPSHHTTVASRLSYPITAAGPQRIFTAFPYVPKGTTRHFPYCELSFTVSAPMGTKSRQKDRPRYAFAYAGRSYGFARIETTKESPSMDIASFRSQ